MSAATPEPIVDEIEAFVEDRPPMKNVGNERNTELKYIEPFLSTVLDWPLRRLEPDEDGVIVEKEYRMDVGSGGKSDLKADYAFLVEEEVRCVVEVKSNEVGLTDVHRQQIKSYIKQSQSRWGVLTNGKKFELYRYRITRDNYEILVNEFSYSDLPDEVEKVREISRESLVELGETGDFSGFAACQLETLESHMDESRVEIRDEFESVLRNQTGDCASIELYRELTEEVLRIIEDQLITSKENATVEEDFANVNLESVSLSELCLDDSDTVRVVSGRDDGGIEGFLKPYNAWPGRICPNPTAEAMAIYVCSEDEREVRYFGVIDKIVPIEKFEQMQNQEFRDRHWYDEKKRVVMFDSVYEIESPLQFTTSEYQAEHSDNRVYGQKIMGTGVNVSFETIRSAECLQQLLD